MQTPHRLAGSMQARSISPPLPSNCSTHGKPRLGRLGLYNTAGSGFGDARDFRGTAIGATACLARTNSRVTRSGMA
jgi:hypothetical protein